MASGLLLEPTLHVEIQWNAKHPGSNAAEEICTEVIQFLKANYHTVKVGQKIDGYADIHHGMLIEDIVIADYTGPESNFHGIEGVALDVQTYTLKPDNTPDRRRISQPGSNDEIAQARKFLQLPNVLLKDEWVSLIYDEALPSRLLRVLSRMVGILKQPGINLSTFNWNRLCLLHGPPGSGKSTLCRALAQKLSIRLSRAFPDAVLVEVSTNSMLSKYFGESGKLIETLFEEIHSKAQDPKRLVCVVMDEIETIAGSREKVAQGGECNDGLRATNQLLTALDRIRAMPNIIVLCTSNLIEAIDPAFLDRVDIKQLIPSPSPAAIYNIFRSCFNELIRVGQIDAFEAQVSSKPSQPPANSPPAPQASSGPPPKRRAVTRAKSRITKPSSSASPITKPPSTASPIVLITSSPAKPPSPSPYNPPSSSSWNPLPSQVLALQIPTLAQMHILDSADPHTPARRLWALAQQCQGLSGRTLRRLPVLGIAMYTWGGELALPEAVAALEAAVEQESKAGRLSKAEEKE